MLFASTILVLAFIAWVGWCILSVRQEDEQLQEFNEKDWKIDRLARPAYLARLVNAVGCGCGSRCFTSVMLYLLDNYAVQPALEKSLKLMEEAEEKGVVPSILCNARARTDMKKRIEEYIADFSASPNLNAISKMFNVAGAVDCLSNHHAVLTLGMDLDVAKEKVKEPVFIVSLPRTGTTILHRTMSMDQSRFRNFDLCDMMMPAEPVPRWDTEGRKALAVKVNALFDQIKAVFPGWAECLETMHGFRPNEADEDLGWYNTGLGHLFMDVLIKLYPECRSKPGGISRLESKELAEYRYAWLEMVMKIYQKVDNMEWAKRHERELELTADEESPLLSVDAVAAECPTKDLPWLMKDPNHSAFLPELIGRFPDAKLIFSHRPPEQIVTSMAKLFVVLVSVEQIPGSPASLSKAWGQEALLRMHQYCDGMVDFTKAEGNSVLGLQKQTKRGVRGNDRRVDFYFKDVVKDIVGTITDVYKSLYPDQPGPSDETIVKFRDYLERNEREKHGNQRRTLEDFHLTVEDMAFSEYNNLFLSDIV